MREQLLFLGTAGGPVAFSKRMGLGSGILIKFDDAVFFLDPGTGSVSQAIVNGLNLRELSAVFVSHRHLNHAGDLNAAISSMTLGGLDVKGVLVAGKDVLGKDSSCGVVDPFFKNAVERIILLEDKKRFGIGSIDIVAEKLIHSDECFGFKFYSDNLCFGYVPDTEYFSGLIDKFKECDVLVLCIKNPSGVSSKYSLNIDDVVNITKGVNPSLLILTHFGSKLFEVNPVMAAREVRTKAGCETVVAKAGLVVEPRTYSMGSIQKRLKF